MKHIVVDLEMNPVSKIDIARRICTRETIEIGAVMLDENMQEISSFRTYVKPEHCEGITSTITNLTGITDAMVVNAPRFKEALRMFTNWCLGTGDEIMVYAWSEADYRQISKEIILKGYEISDGEATLLSTQWSDFQKEFDSHIGFERQVSLKMALDMAGLVFSGREHDALDDARNTAELLQAFRDEALFDVTLCKIQDAMKPKQLGSTLGELFDFSALVSA